jgi:hypothetical protein
MMQAIITHSNIEAANISACIPMTVKRAANIAPKAKRGRPSGAKDLHPRQKQKPIVIPTTISLARDQDNIEISIHYMHIGKTLSQYAIKLNDQFVFLIF